MARVFNERMARAIRSGKKIALLAEIDHPEGLLHFWTGVGQLVYDGKEWTGLGTLGKVAPINYSANLAIQEIVFEISGIPIEDERWLASVIRDRVAFVWLAAFTDTGRVVQEPKLILKAVLDYPKYQVSEDGDAIIQLIARSGFITLERALDEVHSAEDQRRLFANDSGCDLIPSLQQKAVIWKPS